MMSSLSYSQCLTATYGQWPSGSYTPSCNVSFETITTIGYAGQYSRVVVTSGVTYTFKSSVSTDFITISNNGGGLSLATGIGTVVWTPTVTANVRFYTHTNSSCGSASVYRTRSVKCGSVPSNDLVCNAITVSCGTTTLGTTINSTNTGTYESTTTCGGVSQGSGGVWYKILGTGGNITAGLCLTIWDSQISIYSGNTCTALTCIGGNDDNGPSCTTSTSASYTWSSTLGTTYWIKIHGYSSTSTFSLKVDCAPTYIAQIISINTGPSSWCSGETRNVTVTIKNIGTATWTNSSPDINIGVKWNTNGSSWSDYFVRTDANGLLPNNTTTYTLPITARNNIGSGYTTLLPLTSNNLIFDVVYEGNCWFGNNNGSCGPTNSVFISPSINFNCALPIDLIEFSGECVGFENIIRWTTASEQNSDYFIIERSSDLTLWDFVSKVTASGNSNYEKQYSITDRDYPNGISYYRLRQYDFNGENEVFEPISVNCFSDRKIVKLVNILGQETLIENIKGVYFEIYNDGSSVKRFK